MAWTHPQSRCVEWVGDRERGDFSPKAQDTRGRARTRTSSTLAFASEQKTQNGTQMAHAGSPTTCPRPRDSSVCMWPDGQGKARTWLTLDHFPGRAWPVTLSWPSFSCPPLPPHPPAPGCSLSPCGNTAVSLVAQPGLYPRQSLPPAACVSAAPKGPYSQQTPGGVRGQEVAWLEGRRSRDPREGSERRARERAEMGSSSSSGILSKHFPEQESIRIIIPIL